LKFTLGTVFGLAFAVMGKRIVPLLAMTAIVYIGFYFMSLFLIVFVAAIFEGTNAPLMAFAPALTALLPVAALWSTVTDIALLHAADKPVRIGSLLRNGFGNVLPVLLIGVIWAIAVAIGTVLLVVPALVFVVVFMVTVPAYIYEKPGIIGAFARSLALTQGRRWGIFGISLLVNIAIPLLGAIGLVIVAIAGSAMFPGHKANGDISDGASLMILILTFVIFIFTSLFMPLLNAATYVALRADKGEPLSGAIARIFE